MELNPWDDPSYKSLATQGLERSNVAESPLYRRVSAPASCLQVTSTRQVSLHPAHAEKHYAADAGPVVNAGLQASVQRRPAIDVGILVGGKGG